MTCSVLAVSTSIYDLCMAAIGIIIFVPILKAVRKMGLFHKGTDVVVAICVCLLCLIGLANFFGNAQTPRTPAAAPEKENTFLFILLPYAALAISLLIIMVFCFVVRLLGGRKDTNLQENDLNLKRLDHHALGMAPGLKKMQNYDIYKPQINNRELINENKRSAKNR